MMHVIIKVLKETEAIYNFQALIQQRRLQEKARIITEIEQRINSFNMIMNQVAQVTAAPDNDD